MRLLGVDKIITPEVAPNLDGVRKPLIVLLARQPRPQWPIGIHALLAHGQATAALTKKSPLFFARADFAVLGSVFHEVMGVVLGASRGVIVSGS